MTEALRAHMRLIESGALITRKHEQRLPTKRGAHKGDQPSGLRRGRPRKNHPR